MCSSRAARESFRASFGGSLSLPLRVAAAAAAPFFDVQEKEKEFKCATGNSLLLLRSPRERQRGGEEIKGEGISDAEKEGGEFSLGL